MTKTIVMILISAAMAYGGVALARFSEADDAPGGVVIAAVIILGAVALAAKALMRSASGARATCTLRLLVEDSSDAVMRASPGLTAVTLPVPSTEATVGALLLHVTARPATSLPRVSLTIARTVVEPPTVIARSPAGSSASDVISNNEIG